MFAVIYKFNIKPGQTEIFIHNWHQLTQSIYEFEGSLGSRLHKRSETEFIAYAQWPSREKWENSGKNLPEESKSVSKMMKECCNSIETVYELELQDDLLKNETFL